MLLLGLCMAQQVCAAYCLLKKSWKDQFVIPKFSAGFAREKLLLELVAVEATNLDQVLSSDHFSFYK